MPAPTQSDFDSQARTVALKWLALVAANDALNATADAMRATGTPDSSNWMRRNSLPVVADNPQTIDFARELVRRGAVGRDEVHAALPGLLN